jgi:hypothetical protein
MSDWRCLFSVDTEWAELQEIIDAQIDEYLHTWLQTLLDDADLSDRQRAQVWGIGAPRIRAETRRVFEDGWKRLQLEALPASGPLQ